MQITEFYNEKDACVIVNAMVEVEVFSGVFVSNLEIRLVHA